MISQKIFEQRLHLPLELKVRKTEERIWQFSQELFGKAYISFSGGKDSTVLLDIARKILPDIPAVFLDTGLEYPEIRDFVKTIPNVIWLKPKKPFNQVIEDYGYPVVSKEISQKLHEIRHSHSDKLIQKRLHGDQNGNGKISEKWKFLINAPFEISHNCCNVLKKNPAKLYEKETGRSPIVGSTVGESRLREITYLKNGCNTFGKRPMSMPMAFWTDDDVWNYIKNNNLSYSKIYDKGYKRTGCMFCLFGLQQEEKPNRFDLMKLTHPKQYEYCMNQLGLRDVLNFLEENSHD